MYFPSSYCVYNNPLYMFQCVELNVTTAVVPTINANAIALPVSVENIATVSFI